MEPRVKRVIGRILVALVVLGLLAVSSRFWIGFLFLAVFFLGPAAIIVPLLALWALACWGARRLLGRFGVAPLAARALAVGLFIAGPGLAFVDLRASASNSPFEQMEGAKRIALSDVRVVQGEPGCPDRCVAGTVVNQGDRTVSGIDLTLDYRDSQGRTLGGEGLLIPLVPPGPLAPGARATFLHSPGVSLLGINPRLKGVEARVAVARYPDESRLRGLVRWASQAALVFGARPRGRPTEWYSPAETQEYAKSVAVSGHLVDVGGGQYRVEGELDNRGDLPLRAVAVSVVALDADGALAGSTITEVVRYYYDSQVGAYASLPPHGKRPFSLELPLSPGAPSKTHIPVSIDLFLQSVNLGPKPAR